MKSFHSPEKSCKKIKMGRDVEEGFSVVVELAVELGREGRGRTTR